jgi:outer membrane protein TolC
VFPVDAVEVFLERAFQENAELQAASEEREAIEARVRGARWNALPALDLLGSIGGNGLSGTSREVVFGGDTLRVDVDGGYGDALDQAVGRDFPTWSIGLELSFPIPLRSGRGERNRLHGQAEEARQREAAVRRTLEEAIRAAHREVVNGQERLEVAREGLDASFEQVRIGLIEYDNGRATAFELVRLGADLAAAQQRLSQALVRTATAAADLRYLTAESAGGTGNRESSEY